MQLVVDESGLGDGHFGEDWYVGDAVDLSWEAITQLQEGVLLGREDAVDLVLHDLDAARGLVDLALDLLVCALEVLATLLFLVLQCVNDLLHLAVGALKRLPKRIFNL